jgi:hypothetical protein
MKSGIVLSMLLVFAGLFCPAVQAEDREMSIRQLSAEIRLLRKQVKRQREEIARLTAENLQLKTGAAGVAASWVDMNALASAVRQAKPKKDYRGETVRWSLIVQKVQPDRETDGYVLLAKSKEGYLAMVVFPKEAQAKVTGLKRGQTVEVEGTIEGYTESVEEPNSRTTGSSRSERTRPENTVFLGVAVESLPAFGVKLTKPKLIAVHNDGVDIAGLAFNADNIIYLLDSSGSMIEILSDVKSDLLQSVDHLSEEQHFQIVSFSERHRGLSKKWLLATPGNKARAKKFLDPIRAQGQTEAIRTLKDIAKYTRFKKNAAVVLIMDGEVDDSLGALKAVKKLGVPVHALLYGAKPEEAVAFMKSVAKETKGTYRYVPERPRHARKK